jgi:uncharacterized phage protein (TIGR01671 family)
MNRIIKFRAWDIKNKYMFGAGYNDWRVSKIETHDYLKLTLDAIIVRQMSYSDDPSDNLGDLETETEGEYILMQSTGLVDKNGVEIFEGDIVRFRDLGNVYRFPFTGVVTYKAPQFCLERDPINDLESRIQTLCYSQAGYISQAYMNSLLKVIGNTYQHPHLLQAKPKSL